MGSLSKLSIKTIEKTTKTDELTHPDACSNS